jgi:hypothetical protein
MSQWPLGYLGDNPHSKNVYLIVHQRARPWPRWMKSECRGWIADLKILMCSFTFRAFRNVTASDNASVGKVAVMPMENGLGRYIFCFEYC